MKIHFLRVFLAKNRRKNQIIDGRNCDNSPIYTINCELYLYFQSKLIFRFSSPIFRRKTKN